MRFFIASACRLSAIQTEIVSGAFPRFAGVFRFLGSRKARGFFQLALIITLHNAANFRLAWMLLRNVVKRMGVHQALTDRHANLSNFDFILCDEGILHAAHNLFVHTTSSPNPQEILRFANLVPMPDLVIWVTAPPDQSIACILPARSCPRRPKGSRCQNLCHQCPFFI